jgi:hypothetical protein
LIAIIVGGVGGAVVFAILVTVAAFVIRRKWRHWTVLREAQPKEAPAPIDSKSIEKMEQQVTGTITASFVWIAHSNFFHI